jgi:glycosyltransferase involved in cell wall biosynthesis
MNPELCNARDDAMTAGVSVMVFTLDEELNLPHCLASLHWCDDVIVVDSFSTDKTEALCRSAGARFFQHAFEGFGNQRNWALDHTSPRHPWILILDADERVPPALAQELGQIAQADPVEAGAYRVRRRFHLWGRWLRHSSLYPSWVVRFVRHDRVRYRNRGHAETQDVQGRIGDLANDLIDENHKSLDEWFERQNRYSSKDAEFEAAMDTPLPGWRELTRGDPLARRAALKRLAARIPARGLLYFLYSYLWRKGFLDGVEGLMFCRMRALYQVQVEVKAFHARRARQRTQQSGAPT